MVKKIVISLVVLVILAGGAFLAVRFLRNSPEESLKRADEYFEKEEFDAARIEYKNALKAEPSNEDAFRRLAYSWFEQGATLTALNHLRFVVETNPENIEARLMFAQTWLSLRQMRMVREQALEILKRDPVHEEAILLLAKTSYGDEDIAELETILAKFDMETSAPANLVRGTIAQRNGDTKAFEAAINTALTIDPEYAQAYLALSALHGLKSEPAELEAALKKAAELSEARSGVPQAYAAHLTQIGKTEEAVAVLEKLREEAPDYLPTLVQLADIKRSAKEFPEALELVDRVLGSDPGNPSASQCKAFILLDQNEPDKAIKTLEQLDTMTELPITKFQLARLYLGRNKVEEARSKLTEALALNENYAEATLLLARIEIGTGGQDLAASRLERLLKRQPGFMQAEVLLAGAYQQLGRFEDVASIFRDQTQRNPENHGAHFALGRTLRELKKLDEARASLLTAHKLQPENMTYVADLVSLYTMSEDYEAAHALLRPFLASDQSGGAYFLEGMILSAEKKWDDARTALHKALELNPGSQTGYSLLVATYLAEQKPEEAIRELETLLKSNPDSLQHNMLLALLHEQTNENEKAANAYEAILKRTPDFFAALNNLAYLSATKLGNLDRAEELAVRAYTLAQEDPAVNDTLGWIYFQRGKFAEALSHLERAATKLSGNPELQYHLGMARLRMGQSAQAREALEFAANFPQPFSDQEIAREELKRLDNPMAAQEGKSIAELEAYLAKTPNDAAAQLQLGLLREQDGLPDKAAAAFEKATKINSRLVPAWLGLARTLGDSPDHLDQALEAGRQARLLDSDDPAIAALVGHLSLQRAAKGDLARSVGLLREAAQKLDEPAVRWDQAMANYLLGKVSDARSLTESLLKAHPDAPESARAKSLLALTEPGEKGWPALAPLAEERLKEAPNDVPALMVRARVNHDQATTICDGLLERYPDFAPAKIQLAAVALRDAEQTARAEALAREVLTTLPDDPRLNAVRGAIAYRKGEHQNAIDLLEKSKEAQALDADGLFFLGMSYIEANRIAEGSQLLRAARGAGLDPSLDKEASEVVGGAP